MVADFLMERAMEARNTKFERWFRGEYGDEDEIEEKSEGDEKMTMVRLFI